jgi:hypothetical protein
MRGKIKEAYDVLRVTKEYQEAVLREETYGPAKAARVKGIIQGIETSMKVLETF